METSSPSTPGRASCWPRLLLILLVMFPLSWAINALLIGSWTLFPDGHSESKRNWIEWQVIWIAAVAVIFWVTGRPLIQAKLSRFNPRRWIFGLICAASLVALLFAIENWRGARAWHQYRQQLEAKGAPLDFKEIIPKPVPDAQNLAATPFIKSWFEFRGNAEKIWSDQFMAARGMVNSVTNRTRRTFTDLVAWEMAFAAVQANETNREFASDQLEPAARAKAAPAVLRGLEGSANRLAELREASRRPLSQYPVDYNLDDPWGILLPHLAVLRSTCERLELRAVAELAAGQSARAFEDVELLVRMTDSIKTEPFLISYLVRAACVQRAAQPIWEGIAAHAWTDGQLREIQAHFETFDFIGDMKLPLDCERAAGVLTVDLVKKRGLALLLEVAGPGPLDSMDRKVANWCSGLIPDGWFDLELVNYWQLYELQLEGVVDFSGRVSPSRLKSNGKVLERELSRSAKSIVSAVATHHVVARTLLPVLDRIPIKGTIGQVAADQVVIATALERFYLANGGYPETLVALTPTFVAQLPVDPITGQSYQYRRHENGNFVLYSVGWDEKDDHGTPGKAIFDERAGDWVW